MTETEHLLAKSIIYARLDRLSKRIDHLDSAVEARRVGYRLARYRRRLLEQEHAAIEKQARAWDVLY